MTSSFLNAEVLHAIFIPSDLIFLTSHAASVCHVHLCLFM